MTKLIFIREKHCLASHSIHQPSRRSSINFLWYLVSYKSQVIWCLDCIAGVESEVLMRPFGPLAGLCLLLSIILQLALVVHPCKEIKLKFDLQRMVESESNFSCLQVGFHPIRVFSGTAKKICAGTPRITRGMGTNITLEPGERVRNFVLKSFLRWPGFYMLPQKHSLFKCPANQ